MTAGPTTSRSEAPLTPAGLQSTHSLDRRRLVAAAVNGAIYLGLLWWMASILGAQGWTTGLVVKVLFTQWFLKVSWEVILTPVTYAVVGFLKRHEGVDNFDGHTNFTPYSAKV